MVQCVYRKQTIWNELFMQADHYFISIYVYYFLLFSNKVNWFNLSKVKIQVLNFCDISCTSIEIWSFRIECIQLIIKPFNIEHVDISLYVFYSHLCSRNIAISVIYNVHYVKTHCWKVCLTLTTSPYTYIFNHIYIYHIRVTWRLPVYILEYLC